MNHENKSSRVSTVARYLMGAIFFVFGLNGFLQFLPAPPLPAPAGQLIGALVGSGYLMVLTKAVEVLVGLSLLSNRFAPLALVIAAPVTVNIVLFHAFLAPAGMAVPLLLLAAHLAAAWGYRSLYAPLLVARAGSAPALSTPAGRARELQAA